MKRRIIYETAVLTLLVCALLSSAGSAQAALSKIYEGKAGNGAFASAPAAPKAAKAAAVQKPAQQAPAAPATPGVKHTTRQVLAKKYVKYFEKEQATFYKACVDAEMALRYIYSQYAGSKEPSEEEFKAMKFAAELLIKDVQSSAKRYASNLRMAKLAMLQMDEEERTFFAKALGAIFAAPAYAAGIDASAMDAMAGAFDNVANSTPNIDNRTIKDVMKAEQEKNEAEAASHSRTATLYTAGIIGASATKVVTTAAGTLTGMMTGGPIGGTAAFVGGVTQMTVDIVELTDEIKEAGGQKTTKTKGEKDVIDKLKTASTISNVVNIGSGIKDLPRAVKEAATTAEKTAEITKSIIETVTTINSVKEEMKNYPDKPDAPGGRGVKAVKEAKNKAGKDSGSGGGSGGG